MTLYFSRIDLLAGIIRQIREIKLLDEYTGRNTNATAADDNRVTRALCERPLSIHRRERRIARNKAPRFVADAVVNGCAVTGPHSTEPRMRDATHSIVFYILPGVSLPPFLSSSVFLTRSQPPAAPNAEA